MNEYNRLLSRNSALVLRLVRDDYAVAVPLNDHRRHQLRSFRCRYDAVVMVLIEREFHMVDGERKYRCGHWVSVNKGTMITGDCFSFPPYYARRIWGADKNGHVKAITCSLNFYLGTPTTKFSKILQVLLERNLSMWCIFYPERLVSGHSALEYM